MLKPPRNRAAADVDGSVNVLLERKTMTPTQALHLACEIVKVACHQAGYTSPTDVFCNAFRDYYDPVNVQNRRAV